MPQVSFPSRPEFEVIVVRFLTVSTQWFCRILHEEFGPLEIDELRELASSGTLDPGDLVRRNTEDVWAAASKCLELRATYRKLEHTAESLPTRNETAPPDSNRDDFWSMHRKAGSCL